MQESPKQDQWRNGEGRGEEKEDRQYAQGVIGVW